MAKYLTSCCGQILESKYRHDFVRCKCGKTYVDGGDDYSHVGWADDTTPPQEVMKTNDVQPS